MKIYTIIMGIIFVSVLCSCSKINKCFGMKDDNIVEETAEDLLKQKTGIDIDFTPISKEG